MKFFNVLSIEDGKEIVKKHLPASAYSSVEKPISEAVGDVLSEDVLSADVFPPYTRSTVDGYAVRAEDVYCCSASIPSFLKIKGKILMGEMPAMTLNKGEAIAIPTGGVLPVGANAVVMIEHVDILEEEIAVYAPVKNGENTVLKGEELKVNDVIAQKGDVVSPLSVGVFASVGIDKVKVYGKIRVSVLSTGDELADVTDRAEGGKIRDVNTSLLSSLLTAGGYEVVEKRRIPDDEELFRKTLFSMLKSADWILISGGSSIGSKDLTEKVLSEGEVLLHGLALKPGKPTIVAKFGDKTVFGLPGNPLAALCVFQSLCHNAVLETRGQKIPCLYAYAGSNFPSTPGRTTLQPVKVSFDGEKYVATPVFLKSAHLFSALQANGYAELPEKTEGVYQDQILKIYPFVGKELL